jgi:phosphoglycerate dehydrogenase-like enzyme
MTLFVYAHLDERARALVRAGVPDAVFVDKTTAGPAEQARFAEAEMCFGNVPAPWLSGPLALRWLQLESVGFEYYRGIAMPGVQVTNLKGMFAEPTAETALAGLLALYRGIEELAGARLERRWIGLALRERMGLLAGRRALVCGLGSIGARIRALLLAFGCEVAAFARTAPDADLRTLAEVDAALGRFEIVVNALPSTPETANLFDAARLARFAPGAVFVNVGRGSAADEEALIAALESGALGGAVLDVFRQEPLPPDHPLWRMPRTIVTQHTGGGYDDELVDKTRFFLGNLARFRAGEPLLNPVDLARGY